MSVTVSSADSTGIQACTQPSRCAADDALLRILTPAGRPSSMARRRPRGDSQIVARMPRAAGAVAGW